MSVSCKLTIVEASISSAYSSCSFLIIMILAAFRFLYISSFSDISIISFMLLISALIFSLLVFGVISISSSLWIWPNWQRIALSCIVEGLKPLIQSKEAVLALALTIYLLTGWIGLSKQLWTCIEIILMFGEIYKNKLWSVISHGIQLASHTLTCTTV